MITFRENEKVYLIKRRHRLVLWMEIFPLTIFFLIIIISAITILFISSLFWPEWLTDFIPVFLEINLRYFLLFAFSSLSLILWGVIFGIITNYYLDCWIVTNERTIHTELIGFFSRTISTVPHEQIQDISIDVYGILPTIFKYGDLHIQTAGKFREFIFRQIPNPYETKDAILKARDEFLAKRRESFQV